MATALVEKKRSSSPIVQEGALVLEYLAGGTLADVLHGSATGTAPLLWAQRMHILHDVACALEHLHDGGGGTSTAVVHGDVSASNVLLDGATGGGARLCDLGSACEGFLATVVPARAAVAVGSPGYADPFFLRTGIVSNKSDVYGFGVLRPSRAC
ncbi:salt tolerance receptor-like cytoplasmic kinase 1 [Miscanthus floridulus]|uniref:salt tolerance receptor-like cytoplasmic kinase 1 n=1 Tax=Miscanthus floridulus TaxID=154761 RepID=UPI00345A151C